MIIPRILTALMLVSTLIAACSPAAATVSPPEMMAEAPVERDSGAGGETAAFFKDEAQTTVERIVIKNAFMRIVVNDPVSSLDRIVQLSEEMGGYVVSANLSQTQTDAGLDVPYAEITIRVPAERLNEALSRIRSESDRLPLAENIESQDVTSEYTDLQSRLRNLEAAESQLTKIMDSAIKTEDVLAVYSQLTQVREQIEVIKGQIKYYEQSAALSAIRVDLVANAAVQPLRVGRWELGGVLKDAASILLNTLEFLVKAAIYLIVVAIPVLVLVFAPPYLVIRALLRWRARRKAKAQSAALQPQDPVE